MLACVTNLVTAPTCSGACQKVQPITNIDILFFTHPVQYVGVLTINDYSENFENSLEYQLMHISTGNRHTRNNGTYPQSRSDHIRRLLSSHVRSRCSWGTSKTKGGQENQLSSRWPIPTANQASTRGSKHSYRPCWGKEVVGQLSMYPSLLGYMITTNNMNQTAVTNLFNRQAT